MKLKLSTILIHSGIVAGAIAALTLVSQHPIHILILGICVTVYFAGVWLKKKGK